ncbi:MAG: hypothetical protein ACD_20C00328G0003 [uncultured bacterium]|nr:MAG: hypothetical protein ACD_20C00328G0003 [uncultured bacterium]
MQKLSFLLLAFILLVFIFLPLFTAIESGLSSTNGYYGEIY